jgi:acyl-CoA hydrolase
VAVTDPYKANTKVNIEVNGKVNATRLLIKYARVGGFVDSLRNARYGAPAGLGVWP